MKGNIMLYIWKRLELLERAVDKDDREALPQLDIERELDEA